MSNQAIKGERGRAKDRPFSPEEADLALDGLGNVPVRLDGAKLADGLPALDDAVVELDHRREDLEQVG